MEELTLELTSLQRHSGRSKFVTTATCEVQTSPESGTSTPDSSLGQSGSVKLVNGDLGGGKGGKVRMTNHTGKNDSGLGKTRSPASSAACRVMMGDRFLSVGSSLDESISSRKDQISASRSALP